VSHLVDNHDFDLGYHTGNYKMLKIRNILIVLGMLFYSVAFADVQVSIGINVPVYPQLVVVPGYPVYYAPQLESNYFFYDGLYWVFQDDNWYESSWYNGPWWFVDPEDVPLFVLRIPVHYYRQPPTFFFGWSSVSPPRWGEHWGHGWEQHRNGWDRWDHGAMNTPAPLPAYQRQYSGNRYPQKEEQQHELQNQNYRYQARDPEVKQQFQRQAGQRAPIQQVSPQRENPQQEKQRSPEEKGARQKDIQRSAPNQQGRTEAPRSQPSQKGSVEVQRSSPPFTQQGRQQGQEPRQQPQQKNIQREQQNSKSQDQDEKQQDNDGSHDPKRGQEQEQGRNRNE
jgi:hypothetical protein